MNTLAPDRLKELWHCVERKQLTVEEFYLRQEDLLAEHRRTWERALLLEKDKDLQEALIAELGRYFGCHERDALEEWCRGGVAAVEAEWGENGDRSDRRRVERHT